MKIDDITVQKKQVDELDAASLGKAVGKGAKAFGKGVANFAKGVKAGFTGDDASTPNNNLNDIKNAISKLKPNQIQSLRAQIAKKAGVA